MAKFTGIHHPAFATGDMNATIRFWRDLLGLRLVYGYGQPGYRQYFFEISPQNLLAFFEWPGVEKTPPRTPGQPVQGPFAFDHLAIGVATENQLWELSGQLSAAGFPVSDVIDHGFIRSLYSFDPNGIPVEFACPVEGIDIRRSPLFADRHPPEAALAGTEPQPERWPAPEIVPEEDRIIVPGDGSEHFAPPS